MKTKWRWPWRFAFGGTSLLIFDFATIPLPPTTGAGDKTEHLLAFALLGLLARLGWPELSYGKVWLPFLALYGAAIEGVQYFLPYRSADVFDFLADLAGLLLVWPLSFRKRL